MRLTLSTLTLALALAAPAGAQSPAEPQPGPVRRMRAAMPPPAYSGDQGQAEMRLIDGMPTVEVTIGGRGPYRFAVDTGAHGHGRVSPQVADALGIASSGDVVGGDGSGRTSTRRLYALPTMTVGGVEFKNVQASEFLSPPAGRLTGVQGVLGLGLFASHTLTLDYAGGQLRLDRTTLPETATTYAAGPGPLTFPLQIGAESVPTHLDTGNIVAPLILPKAVIDRLPQSGAPRRAGTARTTVSEVQIWKTTLAVPVRFGGRDLSIREVAYPSLGPTGNLGSLALSSAVLQVDQRSRRFSISPVAQAAAGPKCGQVEVAAAERDWLGAYARRDSTAMADILHDDFVVTYPDGRQGNAQGVLEQLRLGARRGAPGPRFVTAGTRIHDFGQVAVLTGQVRQDGSASTFQRYTDTWVCAGGRWRVAASHLSR